MCNLRVCVAEVVTGLFFEDMYDKLESLKYTLL